MLSYITFTRAVETGGQQGRGEGGEGVRAIFWSKIFSLRKIGVEEREGVDKKSDKNDPRRRARKKV